MDAMIIGKLESMQLHLCEQVAEALEEHYPGWEWAVYPQGVGCVIVQSRKMLGRWGFDLRPGKAYSASMWKREAIMAGGELLERYGMPRKGFKECFYGDMRVNVAGQAIPEA